MLNIQKLTMMCVAFSMMPLNSFAMDQNNLPCKNLTKKFNEFKEIKQRALDTLWSVGKYQKILIQCDHNLFKNFDSTIPFKMMEKGRFEIKPSCAAFTDEDRFLHIYYQFDLPDIERCRGPLGFREMVTTFQREQCITIDIHTGQVTESTELKIDWLYEKKLYLNKENIEKHLSFLPESERKKLHSVAFSKLLNPRTTVVAVFDKNQPSKRCHAVYLLDGLHLETPYGKRVEYMTFNKAATVLALILDCGQVILVKPLQRHVPGNYAKDIFFRFQ